MRPTDVKTDLNSKGLRQRFDYDPGTGVFRYKIVPSNQSKIKVGDIAGYVRSTKYGKYLIIKIDGRAYYAHRLVWLYMYGDWPQNQIDHDNGDKLDNRLGNLRPASQSGNKANGPKYKNNTSGYKGVVRCKNRWKAQITFKQNVIYLGLFEKKEDAYAAYVKKARELQGEFFRGY